MLQIQDYGVATGIEQHQLFHLFHRNFGNFNLQVGHNEETRHARHDSDWVLFYCFLVLDFVLFTTVTRRTPHLQLLEFFYLKVLLHTFRCRA